MKREMKHVKKFGVIFLLNKMKSGAKRELFFVHMAVFWEREVEV